MDNENKPLLVSDNMLVKAGTIVNIGPDDLYEHNFTKVYMAAKDFMLQELSDYLGYRAPWSYEDSAFLHKAVIGGFLKLPEPSAIIELRLYNGSLRAVD